MYLFFGSLFAYISTFTLAAIFIIMYLWYFMYDENKKLPLMFQILVLGAFSTSKEETYQYIKENPTPTTETNWRVKTLTVLGLLFCLFNFFIIQYTWPVALIGYYLLAKRHFEESQELIKQYREDDPEYEI